MYTLLSTLEKKGGPWWALFSTCPFIISSKVLTKVETPIHDNDLIPTPIISPQSGWQWIWSCPKLHMNGFRDRGWQFLILGRCHLMEPPIFNTYMNFSRHHLCCFIVVSLFVLNKSMAYNRSLQHPCFKNCVKLLKPPKIQIPTPNTSFRIY